MIDAVTMFFLVCDGCDERFYGNSGDDPLFWTIDGAYDAARNADWLVFEGINLHLCGGRDALHEARALQLLRLLDDVWDRRQLLAAYPCPEDHPEGRTCPTCHFPQ